CDDNPEAPAYQQTLAEATLSLCGLLVDSPNADQAEPLLVSQALPLLRFRLLPASPRPADVQFLLATAYNQLGILWQKTDKRQQAEAALLKALEVYDQLVRVYPQEARDFEEVAAMSHFDLGHFHWKDGQLPAAQVELEKSVEQFRRLAENHPEVAKYR